MSYDVIIIGAGIQGAAVAQAACAKGYKVLLLEQFSTSAAGTSSRSSKLIHGGLRYLESGQFKLVKECLQERAFLLKNAPHLVRLVAFHIPIYRHTTRSRFVIAAGLSIYALFSRKRFQIIDKKKWNRLDGLKTKGLKAVFRYYDAQTDDAQLTHAVLASAQQLGATVEYKATFKSCTVSNKSCQVSYEQDGQNVDVSARCLVNATGPWVGQVIKKISPKLTGIDVDLVQGAHIEIPGKVEQGMYYLESPQDKRAVFVMPWKGHLLVGTTESAYQGDPAKVKPLEGEIEYLLKVYNHNFMNKVGRQDVINAFAGLRVLPHANTKAFSRPRDTMIISDNELAPNVVSLYGGKLTSHRATADKVMEKLQPSLPDKKPIADTTNLTLPSLDEK